MTKYICDDCGFAFGSWQIRERCCPYCGSENYEEYERRDYEESEADDNDPV